MSPNRPPAAAAARSARAARAAVLGLSLGVNAGCYTSRPLMGAPDAGTQAVVTLNDRGRFLLGNALGPNADQVEGSVVSRDDSSFVVAVRTVRYFNSQTNEWKGEHVTVPVAGVRGLQERRFSKHRTWALIGAATAAFVALVISIKLVADNPTIIEQGGGNPPQGT